MPLKTEVRWKRPNAFREKLTLVFLFEPVLISIIYMVSFPTSAKTLIFFHRSGWTEFKM